MADAERHSALIVAVPAAAPVVDGWRERTCDAKPSTGMPPHVTILSPFVPAAGLDDSLVRDLQALFGAFEAFRLTLREIRRFPGVLYLAPDPSAPFAHLTEAMAAAYPDFPPYEGAFDSIVPHMTVAKGDAHALSAAEADIVGRRPIAAVVREALLICEARRHLRWEIRARLPLVPRADL